MKPGPIILLEDDNDDEDIFKEILADLKVPNEIISFTQTNSALEYLKTTTDQPFLIFSDVNIPGENGVSFKRMIDEDPELKKKSIPFIFYSTAADQATINYVYFNLTVQGFFKKSNSYEESKENIGVIINYWKVCKHPNSL